MAILRVENIRKSFITRTLFSEISFELAPSDRVGFVGVNGCGKTTLLNIILGLEPADEGRVILASGMRIARVEQRPDVTDPVSLFDFVLRAHSRLLDLEQELDRITAQLADVDITHERTARLLTRQESLLLEYTRLDGPTYRARTRSALIGLGFSEHMLTRPIAEFSGGQVSKAMLARAILSGAELLLLDEPTNNLDLPSITWLEDFLTQYKGAILLVSHDRAFLDAVTNRIIELENGHLLQARGNYSRYLEQKFDAREAALRLFEKQSKEIKRIEGIIDQQRRWNQAHNYVTIASKQKQIEHLRAGMVAPERDPAKIHFTFRTTVPTGNEVIVTKGLGKSYGDKLIFRDANLFVRRGECLCIIGANGCGKTTLLKILSGRLEQSCGMFKIGAGVKLGYYEQDTRAMQGENDVIGEIRELYPRMSDTELRNSLGAFLFRGDDIYKKVGELSGGERARVQLLKLCLSGANVLLLDEPTNHLDVHSAEALERALQSFEGTVVIVTHDRYLVNRLSDRVVVMRRDGFIEQQDEEQDMFRLVLPEPEQDPTAAPVAEPEPAPNSYNRRKEQRAALAKARQEVYRIEREIERAEEAVKECEQAISAAETGADYRELERLCHELAAREDTVLKLYEQLEIASERTAVGCE